MKINLLILVLLICNLIVSQEYGVGSVVEYDKKLEIELDVYDVPKRFNKVNSQSEIDYSTIGGLLQSYFSASNMDWVKSEYLDTSLVNITRDEDHFEAVRNSSLDDYIQLESIYKFNFNEREIAYVRYAFVFEKIPFPFIGILSMERVNNRWYLSNLLNQGSVYFLLKNFENKFIVDCLNNLTSKDKKIEMIEDRSKNYEGKISISKLYNQLIRIKEDDELFFNNIYDQRMIVEGTEFRNASFDSKPKHYKFLDIFQPFVYDNVQFEEYPKSYKGIVANEQTLKKFEGKPEAEVLKKTPINFISKLVVSDLNYKSIFISFSEDNVIEVVELKEFAEGEFKVNINQELSAFRTLLELVKPSFLQDVFSKRINEKVLKAISTKTGGINVSMFYEYINKNKPEFLEYLRD